MRKIFIGMLFLAFIISMSVKEAMGYETQIVKKNNIPGKEEIKKNLNDLKLRELNENEKKTAKNGVAVDEIPGENVFSRDFGLQKDDIIISINDDFIDNLQSFNEIKGNNVNFPFEIQFLKKERDYREITTGVFGANKCHVYTTLWHDGERTLFKVKSGKNNIPYEEGNINHGVIKDSNFSSLVIDTIPGIDWLFNCGYNRVSGFIPFIGVDIHDKGENPLNIWLAGGYGFARQKFEWNIGSFKRWLEDGSLVTKIYAYDIVGTADRNITDLETLNLLLLRETFYDYYERRGVCFSVNQTFFENHNLSLRMNLDQYFSVGKQTDWSLFWWNRTIRENPAISDGRINSIIASYNMELCDKNKSDRDGWINTVSAEIALKSINSDFEFTKYVIDIRKYTPFAAGYANFDIEGLAGWSSAPLPIQSKYYLGGPNPLRGYALKEFSGDLMFLVKAELVLNPWGIYLFSDMGNAWNKGAYGNEWDGIRDLKSSIGIGARIGHDYSFHIGRTDFDVTNFSVRVELAKALNPSDRGAVFYLNLGYPF